MSVTLDKTCRPSIFLAFIFCMNAYDMTTLLSVLICLGYVIFNAKSLTIMSRSDARVLSMISLPILIMGIVGLVTGFANGNNIYDVLKDEYFFFKVLLYFGFAYLIFKKRKFGVLSETFIWYGVAISLIYAIVLAIYFMTGRVSTETVDQFRKTIPILPYDPVLSIALLLFIPAKRAITSTLTPLFLAIQTAAVVSTMSRMSWLVLVAIAAFYLWNRIKKRRLLWLTVSLVLVLVASSFSDGDHDSQGDGLIGQITYKVTNVFNETMSSKFDDKSDIQEKWRAYEAFQGVSKFLAGDTLNWVFGYGFGALTDIGITMELDGVERTAIPVFHNGYVYLLVKLGAIGILTYVLFLWRMLVFAFKGNLKESILRRKKQLDGERAVLLIILLFMAVITGVFFGIFNNSVFNNLTMLLAIMLLNYGHTHEWDRGRRLREAHPLPNRSLDPDNISNSASEN